jgi:hypothetical protein
MPVCEIKGSSFMNLLIFNKILKKLRLIWVYNKSARKGAPFLPIGMPTTCWNSALLRRLICYRWGTPAYLSLVPRSSMFYLFEFCLKNMWNCSLIQQMLSHRFYDWKLCEWFLLSGFVIGHAVGWYTELKSQKFWWRIPERKILI